MQRMAEEVKIDHLFEDCELNLPTADFVLRAYLRAFFVVQRAITDSKRRRRSRVGPDEMSKTSIAECLQNDGVRFRD